MATGARRPGLAGDALLAAVRAGLAALPDGAAVVLAVSGGPDSAGLALLTTRARPDLDAGAVHVRHGLRADAPDAAAAAGVAHALGLPFAAVPVAVRRAGEGVEAAARHARYAALRAAAAPRGAAVLVGHTADDQAETVLLALGRGTGIRGLGGMRPSRDDGGVRLVRPLLAVRRADVRAAVAAAGLPTVADPTNTDDDLRRVRVRTAVLPAVATLAGDRGDPVAVLTRLADLARADDDLLAELAAAEAARLVRAWGPVRLLPVAGLAALPAALRGRVVHAVLAGVRGRAAGVRAADVDRVLGLAEGGRASVVGGLDVARDAAWLTVAPAPAPAPAPALAPAALTVPGSAAMPVLGLAVSSAGGAAVIPPWGEAPARGTVPAGAWVVRGARPGDVLPGGRGLAGRLRAAGVPRALTGLVPVVAPPGPGPVAWAAGVGGGEGACEGTAGGVPVALIPACAGSQGCSGDS